LYDERLKEMAYTSSIDVEDIRGEYGPCECDFGIMAVDSSDGSYDILIGEVIGQDGKGKEDILKLRRFPQRLPGIYLCVSTIGKEFSDDEHGALAELRNTWAQLIIMTRDELEPVRLWGLWKAFPDRHLMSWADLAAATQAKYLGDRSRAD